MTPRHDADELLSSLTEREREILALIGRGHSMPEIARMLDRSVRTVQAHRYSLGRKLEARSSLSLARLAIELGLAPIGEAQVEVAENGDVAARVQQVLLAIEAGIGTATERAFLDRLVVEVARALRVPCAILAEVKQAQARVLAGWHKSKALASEADSDGACPFAAGPPDGVKRVERGLAEAYPECSFVREAGFESYLGVSRTAADGAARTTLAIMNDGPLEDDAGPEVVLRLFVGRASAELERWRARRGLRLSEARYRGVAERCTDPICRFGPTLRLTFANPAMAELLHTPHERLVGQSLLPFIALPDQPVLRRLLQRLGPHERSVSATLSLTHAPEARRHWHLQAIICSDGEIIEYQAIAPVEK